MLFHPTMAERWRAMRAPASVFGSSPARIGVQVAGLVFVFYLLSLTMFTVHSTRLPHTFVPLTLAFVLLATLLLPHVIIRPEDIKRFIKGALGWYLGVLVLLQLVVSIGILGTFWLFPQMREPAENLWDRLNPRTPWGLAATDITGTYAIAGTDSAGEPYEGRMVIQTYETSYNVVREIGDDRVRGIGVVQGDVLSISIPSNCGVASYQIRANGTLVRANDTLDGVWGLLEHPRLGSEVAQLPAGASGDALTGTYTVTGINENGGSYTGDLTITGDLAIDQKEAVYQLNWDIGNSTQEGVGILQQQGASLTLSVGWIYQFDMSGSAKGSRCGVVSYQIQPDGTLQQGKWVEVGANQFVKEQAER